MSSPTKCWRNVLDILMKNKTFRAQLDQNLSPPGARKPTFAACLCSADLTPDFIEHLKESVELVRYAPGQSSRARAKLRQLYLCIFGRQRFPGKTIPAAERVLAYLSRGDISARSSSRPGGVW